MRCPWIGFDLDDTLHQFRQASGAATNAVLSNISSRYGTSVEALRDEYSRILKSKTAAAFSDGRTSADYRTERFSALLGHFSIPPDQRFMAELLEMYESNLGKSLELKPGALQFLSTLKQMGKKIVIVTEGPQDAQERTVQALGIQPYIDFLASTNHFGVTKVEGLFPRVCEYLNITPGDMVYIGDSVERDIKPATAAGILCIHLDEARDTSVSDLPLRAKTLADLRPLFSCDGT